MGVGMNAHLQHPPKMRESVVAQSAASARVRREARVVNEGMVAAIRWLGKSGLT